MRFLIASCLIAGSLTVAFLIEVLFAGINYFRVGDFGSVDAGVRDTIRFTRGQSLSPMHPAGH